MEIFQSETSINILVFTLIAAIILGAINLFFNIKILQIFRKLRIPQTNTTLQELLDEYLDRADKLELKNKELDIFSKDLAERVDKKLGRVGFLRFNPYKDTGGNQSFCVAFLDDTDSGIVITTLYRRGQTQTFSKPIEKGESEHKLTDEEKTVIKMAINNELNPDENEGD